MALPAVGLVGDFAPVDGHPAHVILESYVAAVRGGADALPLLIPALDPPLDPSELLARVDGVFFSGSPSNVSPELCGGAEARDPSLLSARRDATAMTLVRAAIAAGKPVLAVCRGLQELNVALGGTLHQHIHELPGRLDHREKDGASLDVQYGPAHAVTRTDDGLLARIATPQSFTVNSLHSQGIDRLAPLLRAEASAPDGQIEAVSMPRAKGFLLATQWHPEWRWSENEVSRAIYDAFGRALRGLA
ncbi:MAG: gamma-glutamyl-gamma-aminobutyrate hydrolase family protein [Alphaproteobacteria bacterium]|nr:gamma-glutamyl-gamma-aminobutyrate hydrolase family protein [Alphaproteobacteria bacterium]